jgi:hypothetical protein
LDLLRDAPRDAPVLVEWYTAWCARCARDDVAALARAAGAVALTADADALGDAAAAAAVRDFPTHSIFVRGALLETSVGADAGRLGAALARARAAIDAALAADARRSGGLDGT